MARDYFPCRYSYRRILVKLSDQEVGRLFKALLEYGDTGERPELSGRESVAFEFMADDLDRANEAYQAKVNVNKENGRKGGRPKKSESVGEKPKESENNRTVFSETEEKPIKERKAKQSKAKEGNSIKRFAPPTPEEVQEYCDSRGNGISGQHFCDWYATRGWKVGRDTMKDWKAAVRTWERNGYSSGTAKTADSATDDGGFAMGNEELEAIARLKRMRDSKAQAI